MEHHLTTPAIVVGGVTAAAGALLCGAAGLMGAYVALDRDYHDGKTGSGRRAARYRATSATHTRLASAAFYAAIALSVCAGAYIGWRGNPGAAPIQHVSGVVWALAKLFVAFSACLAGSFALVCAQARVSARASEATVLREKKVA